jgi:DNA transposition AAA+ family ATPase
MSEDRLQQIERILQATIVLTQQNREDLVTLTQATKTNTANIRRLEERLNQFVQIAEADREAIRIEATGIRTEIVRILEYLFGQRNGN